MGNLDGRVWDVSDNFVKICELRVGVCPSVSNPSHDLFDLIDTCDTVFPACHLVCPSSEKLIQVANSKGKIHRLGR